MFQPGVSGNPAGRPSPVVPVLERFRQVVDSSDVQTMRKLVANEKEYGKLKPLDAMITMRCVEAFERGGMSSMSMLLDRLIGKPEATNNVKVSGQLDMLVSNTKQDQYLIERMKGNLITDVTYTAITDDDNS